MSRGRAVGVAVMLMIGALFAACDTANDGVGGSNESVEFKLAAIHGDFDTEAEFGRILDQLQAGGATCNPDSDREHVGDVIVGSWEQSGEQDSLLDWARALATACS